jgi:hypothetical protein
MCILILSILILIVPALLTLHQSPEHQHFIRGDSSRQFKARNCEIIAIPKSHQELGWLSDLLSKLSKSDKNPTNNNHHHHLNCGNINCCYNYTPKSARPLFTCFLSCC